MTLLAFVSWTAMIFLYAPLSAAVLYAFSAKPLLTWPFEGWSLQWFSKLFFEAAFRRAFLTSFGVALTSALIATAIGTAAAMVFTRSESFLSRFVQVTTRVPVMLPGLFIGIALVAFMIATGTNPGLPMIVLAHVIVSIPWVILVLTARLRTYDVELEAAARDLGCSPLQMLMRVTLPLISPALIGAFLLTFAGSFDENSCDDAGFRAGNDCPALHRQPSASRRRSDRQCGGGYPPPHSMDQPSGRRGGHAAQRRPGSRGGACRWLTEPKAAQSR